jgi:CO dehydrogenase/acetyl-CoA synthase delta subunit
VRVGARVRVRIGYNLRKDGQDIGGARRRSGGSRAWAVRESNRKDRKGTERDTRVPVWITQIVPRTS